MPAHLKPVAVLELDDLRDRPQEDPFERRVDRRGHGATAGLKIVIIATMKPPIAGNGEQPHREVCPAAACQDHAAVPAKMASSTNVLTVVPCTVIVVLRGAP